MLLLKWLCRAGLLGGQHPTLHGRPSCAAACARGEASCVPIVQPRSYPHASTRTHWRSSGSVCLAPTAAVPLERVREGDGWGDVPAVHAPLLRVTFTKSWGVLECVLCILANFSSDTPRLPAVQLAAVGEHSNLECGPACAFCPPCSSPSRAPAWPSSHEAPQCSSGRSTVGGSGGLDSLGPAAGCCCRHWHCLPLPALGQAARSVRLPLRDACVCWPGRTLAPLISGAAGEAAEGCVLTAAETISALALIPYRPFAFCRPPRSAAAGSACRSIPRQAPRRWCRLQTPATPAPPANSIWTPQRLIFSPMAAPPAR